jgi:hypothetical protein
VGKSPVSVPWTCYVVVVYSGREVAYRFRSGVKVSFQESLAGLMMCRSVGRKMPAEVAERRNVGSYKRLWVMMEPVAPAEEDFENAQVWWVPEMPALLLPLLPG